MDGAKSITATFAINTYALDVATVGNGTEAKSPDQPSYEHGSTVQLTRWGRSAETESSHSAEKVCMSFRGGSTTSNVPRERVAQRNAHHLGQPLKIKTGDRQYYRSRPSQLI